MTPRRASLRLLVAEDDPATAGLITDVLELEGIEVTVVPDGDIALGCLDRRMPDLVILDIMMPRVSGLTVLRRMRERPEMRTLPVILLTAKADPQTIWQGWEAGCDLYLTKPFRPSELIDAVSRLLVRRATA